MNEELERIAETFHKSEKAEYLSYIWSTEFAEWDRNASTTEAIQRANEAQARAEQVWNRLN